VVKDAHDLTEKQMAAFARCARGGFNTGPREQDSSRPVTPGGLDEGSHAGLPLIAVVGTNAYADAASVETPQGLSTSAAKRCKGVGGVANNFVAAVTGSLQPAILGEANLGTPYLDGNVVRVDSSVPFYSWGSCSSQVAFQMQSKVCGALGCHWITRNHGTFEFLWAHDDTGVVSQQVAMGCRDGTNSYRVHMAVVGVKRTGDVNEAGKPEPPGVEIHSETEDGPVVKLTC